MIWTRHRKTYADCPRCGEVVRVNKPLLGALHLCITDDGVSLGLLEFDKRGPFNVKEEEP